MYFLRRGGGGGTGDGGEWGCIKGGYISLGGIGGKGIPKKMINYSHMAKKNNE